MVSTSVASRLHTCLSHCQLAGVPSREGRVGPPEAAICQELLHSFQWGGGGGAGASSRPIQW